MKKITKSFPADVTVSDGERSIMATFSTSVVDRDGEVLIPQGCNAKDYEQNPIVPLLHSYWSLPVAKCVALKRTEDALIGKIQFAERPATYPAAQEWIPDTLFSLYQQGVMNAFSVGLEVMESRPATDKDISKFGAGCRRVTSKWKLLEVSCVPLPCNPEAVAMAVSKGILSKPTAKGIFGYEAKDAATMATCKGCKKEFPLDDMTLMDGDYYCSGCVPEEKSATPPPPAPIKTLVYLIPKTIAIPSPSPVKSASDIVADAVRERIAKAQGRIYLV